MKRILLPAGGAILATGLLAAGLAGTATASGVIDDAPLTPSNKVAETVDFWLKANGAALRAATVYRYDYKEVEKVVMKGGYTPDTKPGSTAPIGEEKKTAVKVQNVNLPKSIGKVFFEGTDGKLYWCSATSIQSKYRNLVATAGHCVYQTGGNGHVLNKWVFVPGYYQGKANFGIYVGKQAFTHYDFANYEDYDRDYAFVTVYNGIRLTNGQKKVVSKEDWDKYEGIKDAYEVEISEAEYQKCKDFNGKETADCYAKPSSKSENVGPSYPGAVASKYEVTKDQYDAATPEKAPWPQNGSRFGEAVTEHVTESEYKSYSGPGYRKIDGGNFTITHYYLTQWVKVTEGTKYYKAVFYILDGFSKDVGRLGDNVGGQGFAWNQPTGKYVRTFGYPGGEHLDGNKPYTGVTPKWCYNKTSAKANVIAKIKAEELVSLKCAVTAGYNGSPWLLKYSNAKRLGYVNGVTTAAFGDLDGNNRFDTIFSSYFDGETAAVYKAAEAVWSGKVG
ncbi:trypsin-like serine peptidase [Nonomuraea sp. 10N515B]|uniref:trypsin-like serine peptidase n=1 Tax=Nonomuraea sp. 10N515B TaxID=3457422 RepID=UPI003FCDF9F0